MLNESRYTRIQVVKNLLHYRDPTFPTVFGIELAEWCNRRCAYCPNALKGSTKKVMSDEVLQVCISRLKEIQWTGIVTINGYSEPLANPRLPEQIKQIKEIGCKVAVYSNGDYLTEELAAVLCASGCDHIVVTEHAPYNKKWQSRVDRVLRRFPDQIQSRRLHAAQLMNPGGLLPIQGKPRKRCMVPTLGMTIQTDGTPRFCCCDFFSEEKMPSLATHSILEIWKALPQRAIRWELMFGYARLSMCKACLAGRQRNSPNAKGDS